MRSVADLPAAAAEQRPDHPAVIDPDGCVMTWGELEHRVAALAGGLLAKGVEPGDRVAVMLPNTSAFPVAYWGVLRAGGTVVPVNPAYTAVERDHLLSDSGAHLLLTDAADDLPAGVARLDPAALTGPPAAADALDGEA